jgi:hypothetical protein
MRTKAEAAVADSNMPEKDENAGEDENSGQNKV